MRSATISLGPAPTRYTGRCCDAPARKCSLTWPWWVPANPLRSVAGLPAARSRPWLDRGGPGADQARELRHRFSGRILRGAPWVRRWPLHWTAPRRCAQRHSQWITSPAARVDGHTWRARAYAITHGHRRSAGRPVLNVPGNWPTNRPQLVVGGQRFADTAKCFYFSWLDALAPSTAAGTMDTEFSARKAALERLPRWCTPKARGQICPPCAFQLRGVNELHVGRPPAQ